MYGFAVRNKHLGNVFLPKWLGSIATSIEWLQYIALYRPTLQTIYKRLPNHKCRLFIWLLLSILKFLKASETGSTQYSLVMFVTSQTSVHSVFTSSPLSFSCLPLERIRCPIFGTAHHTHVRRVLVIALSESNSQDWLSSILLCSCLPTTFTIASKESLVFSGAEV